MQGEIEQKTRFSQRAVFRAGATVFFILLIFVIFRYQSLPSSFGQYGYYRGDNVTEWISMDQSYAPPGNTVCRKCHGQVVQATSQAEHGKLDCQSCHGPLMAHVRKPAESHPKVAGNAELCGTCHRELVGRTKEQIATVKVGEHSGGLDCVRCHHPHQPLLSMIGGRQQ
ncbi:MAG: cytochrome c3 family protein [Desulfitobacteriaceae bacterium]